MNIPTEPQFDMDQWHKTLRESAQAAKQSMKEAEEILHDIAKKVDARDLFTTLFSTLVLVPADMSDEVTHGSIFAKLELLAFHLFPFFGASSNKDISPWHVQSCAQALDELFHQRWQHQMLEKVSYGKKIEPLDDLLRFVHSQAEIVRGSAFPEQTSDEIASVQGRFESWFKTKLVIGPLRAQEILWAVIRKQEEIINSSMEGILTRADKFKEQWIDVKRRSKKEEITPDEKRLLELIRKQSHAGYFGYVSGLCLISSKLPVKRLALKGMIPIPSKEEWKALCGLVGLTKQLRLAMTEVIEIRHRTLFVIPNKGVLLGDISNTLDSLWDRFEDEARKDKPFYNKKYRPHKSRWLEGKASSHLARIFPQGHIYQNLTYLDPDKNDGSTTEIDSIVHWGPFLVLVETKATQFRFESQLGDVGRLRTDMQKNIEGAFEQARRAVKYIDSVSRPKFKEIPTSRELTFDRDSIKRIYLLTISQHHLAGIATRLGLLEELGLFKDKEYPLSMCVADLEIISEFCPGPDVFLHYLQRRLDIQRENINIAADEVSYFGAYLCNRLKPEKLWEQEGEKRPDFIWLADFHVQFDHWWEYKRGDRTEAPEIKLKIPDEIEEILKELRSRKDDDAARWIAFSLLDLSDESLEGISQMISKLKNMEDLTPGLFRRAVHQEGDTVFSIIASLDLPPPALQERTLIRTMVEKYRRKVAKSVGIGFMMESPDHPCISWEEGPWEHDDKMEELIASEPPFTVLDESKMPKRNQPCLCGSGKKFKKCCLPKIEEAKRMGLQ
ncbi:MAG: SEC-C metal-binding domain-containing protein [bacterium]|nr:SEC-C metal-binding domain-containing protein [bacterium]